MDDDKRTRGGIHISGGTVNANGDMVGGDKIVHGDVVHGDKVGGDKMGDNSFKIGTVTGDGNVFGSGTSNVVKGLNAQELAQLIQAMNGRIDQRPEDPQVDKSELKETVEKIDKEAKKGDDASPDKLTRWVNYLGEIAPDVLEVAATTLLNPVAGVTLALKNIIKKAQEANAKPATSG